MIYGSDFRLPCAAAIVSGHRPQRQRLLLLSEKGQQLLLLSEKLCLLYFSVEMCYHIEKIR